MRKFSISVPGRVALIGFDDVQHFSITRPSVSAVEQPIDRISEKAFDLLLRQIEGKEIAAHEWSSFLPVDLIVRESSVRQI
jgi:DNA-binding LacI/PurR family transcriptional regulator